MSSVHLNCRLAFFVWIKLSSSCYATLNACQLSVWKNTSSIDEIKKKKKKRDLKISYFVLNETVLILGGKKEQGKKGNRHWLGKIWFKKCIKGINNFSTALNKPYDTEASIVKMIVHQLCSKMHIYTLHWHTTHTNLSKKNLLDKHPRLFMFTNFLVCDDNLSQFARSLASKK